MQCLLINSHFIKSQTHWIQNSSTAKLIASFDEFARCQLINRHFNWQPTGATKGGSCRLSPSPRFAARVRVLFASVVHELCSACSWITLLLDPTVWLDGASPTNTCILPSFPWMSPAHCTACPPLGLAFSLSIISHWEVLYLVSCRIIL